MSDYIPIFPQELATDILTRLPAKTICRFRCVSRSWRSLLTDPHFIHSRFPRQEIHNPENLILISHSDHTLHTVILNPGAGTDQDAVARKISIPGCPDKWETVVGSCHGLVVVETSENSLYLINPTILESVKIPNNPLCLDPSASFCMHGFGYDDSTDDYKIVTLSYYDTDNEHEPDCEDTFVDVYSVKNGSWTRFKVSPYDHAVPELASGVFVNGGLHWLASGKHISDEDRQYPSVIAVFYLNGTDFEEVLPPTSLDKGKFVFNKLVVVGGCLGIAVDLYNDNKMNVWLMQEYGVQESWSKITISIPEDTDTLKPICKLLDKEIVSEKDGEKLLLHSLEEKTTKEMVVAGLADGFECGVVPFSGTLLSPNFLSRNTEWHSSEGQN